MPDDHVFEIRVEISDVTLTCQRGETIMQCAWRNGFYWPTICGGNGECGVCRFEAAEHAENLAPETDREAILFRTIPRVSAAGLPVRFACCAIANGPVVARRKGIVPKAK